MSRACWRSTLASTFTGLGFSRTLIALLSSYLLFAPVYFEIGPCPGTCLDQAGAWFGLKFLCLSRLSLPGGPRAFKQVDLSRLDGCQVWVWVWREASNFFRWRLDWMPPILSKRTCLWQVGARFGLGLAQGFLCLLSLSLPGLRGLNQVDLSRLDVARFGFRRP